MSWKFNFYPSVMQWWWCKGFWFLPAWMVKQHLTARDKTCLEWNFFKVCSLGSLWLMGLHVDNKKGGSDIIIVMTSSTLFAGKRVSLILSTIMIWAQVDAHAWLHRRPKSIKQVDISQVGIVFYHSTGFFIKVFKRNI